MFGMNPVLLDDKANELMGNDQSGALCLKTPWPGMARTVVGDHERSHVCTNFLNIYDFFCQEIFSTGKSLSEALIVASTNPQYDDTLY